MYIVKFRCYIQSYNSVLCTVAGLFIIIGLYYTCTKGELIYLETKCTYNNINSTCVYICWNVHCHSTNL